MPNMLNCHLNSLILSPNIFCHISLRDNRLRQFRQKAAMINILEWVHLSPKFQFYFKKGSSKNFLWASRLSVGRREKKILSIKG